MIFRSQLSRILAVLFMVLALPFGAALANEISPVPATNLATKADADAFGRKIVDYYKNKAFALGVKPEELDPITVVHLGNHPPEALEWVMLHLEAGKIPAKLELITEDQVDTELKRLAELDFRESSVLTYKTHTPSAVDEKRRRTTKEVLSAARLSLKRLFGLPNGFTLWFKWDRTGTRRAIDAGLGLLSGAIAGSSIAYSFYLSQKVEGADVHPLRAGIALGTWVWLITFESRRMSEFLTQSKVLVETKRNTFEATNSKLFTYCATLSRSLITNLIIFTSAFGLESALNLGNIEHSMWNSTVSMFARTIVDDWLSKKMPTLNDDGTITVDRAKGQWTLAQWTLVNSVWNVLFYFGKNVHLLGLGSWGDWTYYVLGAAGVGYDIWQQRYNIHRKATQVIEAIKGIKPRICESLVIGTFSPFFRY